MIYNINESGVPLLRVAWDENLLEINHYFNLSPSVNDLLNLAACYYSRIFISTSIISKGIWYSCVSLMAKWTRTCEQCASHGRNEVLQVPPVDHGGSDRLFAGMTSEPARAVNLPGPPAGARTRHLLKPQGAKCWVVMLMVGAFGLYVGRIVTWRWSPLPFPTVALNDHSAAPLAN